MAQILPVIARDWALFLDVDGTLLDDAPEPELVAVPPALRETLAVLRSALGGAVAVVSGRRIDDLDRLFAPLCLPVAGQHGAEARREDSIRAFATPSSALTAILAPVYGFAEKRPAIRIEDKGLSAAIHYRGDEPARDALGAMVAEALVRSGGAFRILPSHLAFDIVPNTANKGRAVDWFMAAAPFAGRVPIFIGDDRTDEDGFAAAIAHGGHAIKIGDHGASIAPWHMPAPQQLRQWLARSAAALVACA